MSKCDICRNKPHFHCEGGPLDGPPCDCVECLPNTNPGGLIMTQEQESDLPINVDSPNWIPLSKRLKRKGFEMIFLDLNGDVVPLNDYIFQKNIIEPLEDLEYDQAELRRLQAWEG